MQAPAPDADPAAPNRFTVDVRRDDDRWTVVILGPQGETVSTRVCRDESEARTYASTVRQHVEWLSETVFREYYRLDGEG